MIRLSGLAMPLSYTEETLRRRVAKELKVPPSVIAALRVYRRSVDARHKENVVFQITVDVTLGPGRPRRRRVAPVRLCLSRRPGHSLCLHRIPGG